MNNTPSLKQVQNKFLKVKEIICLANNIKVDVTGTKNFEFNNKENSWTSTGGYVVFWENGIFAKITEKCACVNCGCKDK